MPDPHSPPDRRAALAVEAAIVLPVIVLLLLAIIVIGIGVFRQQQVVCLACEAARWTAVRGSDRTVDTDEKTPTQQQIQEQCLWPLALGMEREALSLQVEWIDQMTGTVVDWDKSTRYPKSLTADYAPVNNTVRVTVTYRWTPPLFLGSGLTLESKTEVPLLY